MVGVSAPELVQVVPPLTQSLPALLPEGGGHGPVSGLTAAGLHLRVEHLAGLEGLEERQPGGDQSGGQQCRVADISQLLLSPLEAVSLKGPGCCGPVHCGEMVL